MKSNPKTKTIIIIILGVFFVFLPIFTNNPRFTARDRDIPLNYNNEFDQDILKISAVSGKIHIDGNSGWAAFKAAGNCTGNGTYSEPYFVEDSVIDVGGSGISILIENSDVHFRIEKCTVYNSMLSESWLTSIIKFYNVSNGQLINNIVNAGLYGIFLEDSDNNTVSENTVPNFGLGPKIRLKDSNNNNISGNIANNYFYTSTGFGISLENSDDNTVSGNTLNYNYEGISSFNSDRNTISGNNASYNWAGIYFGGGGNGYNSISGNTANNNDYGILLGGSIDENNNISGNTVNNNNIGIELYSNDNNLIMGNIVSNNSNYGIILEKSDKCIITFNTITNNSVGIYLYLSYFNQVSNNIFSGNNVDFKQYFEPEFPFTVVITVIVIIIAMAIASMLIIRRKTLIKKAVMGL